MRNLFLVAILLFAGALSVQAQKFGYVNSEQLLSEMEEMKAAESDLIAYRDQQQKLFQTKIEAFQAEVQKFQADQEAGNLTPKQVQETGAKLQAKQETLGQEEQKISEQLQQRRQEKIQPIFDKVNTAIASIAKEDELTYVFDGSTGGVILYADESADITTKVKTKLATM